MNIFGKNQFKVSPNARWDLWGATEGNSGIVNLNGTSLEIGTINFAGSSRNLILDFGMSDHGMTNEQLAAQGITSEMINATGAGERQTIAIWGFTFNEASLVEDCYVLIRNFIVGEDRVLSYTKLSELTLNGELVYSDSVLEENILRFDGYIDSEKYGVDYYLAEVETTDAYGASCWEYYIIPEPADIAALIGALALGFAFLRRRRV